MKKIRCPKCEAAIQFDETRYEPGRILVFQCPECNKRFKMKLPAAKPTADTVEETTGCGGKCLSLPASAASEGGRQRDWQARARHVRHTAHQDRRPERRHSTLRRARYHRQRRTTELFAPRRRFANGHFRERPSFRIKRTSSPIRRRYYYHRSHDIDFAGRINARLSRKISPKSNFLRRKLRKLPKI